MTSLYTNISKQLLKQSIEKRYFQIARNTKIPLNEILNACALLMDNTYFQFNNKFYKQSVGTPMGSPISGLFADLVMDNLESECLQKLSFKPIFFYR